MTQASVFRATTGKFTGSGVPLVALGAALWGMDSVFVASLVKHLSSPEIVFIEHVLLGLFAVPVLVKHRKQFASFSWRDWGALIFIGWGGSALGSVLFTQAFMYGNASVVLILQKSQPIFAILMARLILGERLAKRYPLYAVLALIGTYLLTFGFSFPQNLHDLRLAGSLLSLGAAALWGGSTVMGRLLLDKMEFEAVTSARFLTALPLLFVMVLIARTNWSTMVSHMIVPSVLLNLLFQALLPSLLSLLLYYRGLSRTKASYATIAELAFPATGLLLNWVVLHQGITIGQFVGFVIVWGTVFQMARFSTNEQRGWKLSRQTLPCPGERR